MQHTDSVTPLEALERWAAIVRALMASGIAPDVVTFAALALGTEALAKNLGILDAAKAKRSIGFVASPEQR